MSFAAPIFLWYFMPLVLGAYWLAPRNWRNWIVVAGSLVFYSWGAGEFVFLLLACMVVNFLAGIAIDSERLHGDDRTRKLVLAATIVFDLSILVVWKYAGFASRQIDTLANDLGLGGTGVVDLVLPIGISFFTFHHISYVVDVYRETRHAQRHPLAFATYIGMFPQLVAGPIVRYHEISDQLLDYDRDRWDDFAKGFPRFALGLAKKVIVADSIAPVADAAFATSGGDLTTPAAWLGALAFSLQIYFDFSGYSDMAIGLGQMLGFRLPENFNRPYSSESVTDFWRRWHMSLSRWFRDYLYVPLGGNRGSAAQTYRNLVIVFFLTGFWHGANWTFIVWGLYHGGLLVIERATGYRKTEASGVLDLIARRALTAMLVIVGWVFFRAASIGDAWEYLKAMFTPDFGALPAAVDSALTNQRTVILIFAALVFLMPATLVMGQVIERFKSRPAAAFRTVILLVAAPYAAIQVTAGTFSPFLYFQF